MNNLDQLGRRLAGLQDRQLSALQPHSSAVSPALGEHLLQRTAERRRGRRLAAVSTVAVLLVAIGVTGSRFWPVTRPVTVASVRAQAGQRVAADSLALALTFDDGSEVVLASGASLRTDTVGPASASLRLERGHATVHVIHTQETRWTVHAGSYAIAVTGTRFRLDWRPERGAFSLAVEEGSVVVSGGLLRESIDIRTGQSVTLEQGRQAGSGKSRAVDEAEPRPPPLEAPAPGSAPVAPAVRKMAHHSGTPSWRAQAEAGHYRDALAGAERHGFERLCREAAVADLLTLAEAARYAGRPNRAEQSLKAIRGRFGGSDDAAMAAYLLGRISAENRRDHSGAARWFRTYLDERPSGRLNREAEGRLLESLAFMDRNTAREAARLYLEHYPMGPHAAFARNLLGR